MRTRHIIVSNKQAIFSRREGGIVCGNADYQVQFHFDAEWDAYQTKTARFIWNGKRKDVEFNGSVCPVPIVINTTALEVGVFVENLSTTTSAIIPCKKSVRCNSNLKDEGTVVMPEGLIKPAGNMLITSNGLHDVTERETVTVNVPTGGSEEIPDHADSDFTLHLTNTGEGELGVVYSSTEKVSFDAAPSGKILATFFDANYKPSNIKKDVEMFGLIGEYEGDVSAGGIDTLTMSVGGGNPLGIIYFDGEKTVSWADTATIEPLTVACDTPIIFYDPMSSSMSPITFSYYATGAIDIQPLRDLGGSRIYVIPSSEWAGSLIDVSY